MGRWKGKYNFEIGMVQDKKGGGRSSKFVFSV
jgi:hypothetical protein